MRAINHKPFTGYHMAAILIGFFGIVIAVNITMARLAIGSFGGTVVDNSYVASQNYNRWLAEAEKEAKLGWTVTEAKLSDGRLLMTIADKGIVGDDFAVIAEARHPLEKANAQRLAFTNEGNGRYISQQALPGGRWLLQIEVTRGPDRYRKRVEIR